MKQGACPLSEGSVNGWPPFPFMLPQMLDKHPGLAPDSEEGSGT